MGDQKKYVGQNRRQHERHAARLRVVIRPSDTAHLYHRYTRDISKGGMYIESGDPRPVGTQVHVDIYPPGHGQPIELVGEVVHVVKAEEARFMPIPPGMGVRFTNLDDARRAEIESFLGNLVRTPAPVQPVGLEEAAAAVTQEEAPTVPAPAEAAPPAPDAGAEPSPSEEAPAEIDPGDLRQEVNRLLKGLEEKTHYQVLGIPPSAGGKEVKHAFGMMARRYHPDRHFGRLGKEMEADLGKLFRRINLAHDVLVNPQSRANYDATQGYFEETDDPEVNRARQQVKAELRRRYAVQYRENVRRGEHCAQVAHQAVDAGDLKQAVSQIKLALSFDPLNDDYERELRELQSRLAPPEE